MTDTINTTDGEPTWTDLVNNGIAYLNEREPGWIVRINLDTLDLSDAHNCILGQLYGVFAHGTGDQTYTDLVTRCFIVSSDDIEESMMELGYDTGDDHKYFEVRANIYTIMTATWEMRIREILDLVA